MVDNVLIQCDYCKAKIRMRFQMGYFDIPFDFPCPECGVHIHGLRKITEEHSLKLNNAAVVEFDLHDADPQQVYIWKCGEPAYHQIRRCVARQNF